METVDKMNHWYANKTKTSLDELISDLDADRWNQWMSNLSSYYFLKLE